MMVATGLEKQLWKRVAIVFAAVGLILLVGKVVPLPGITVVEYVQACNQLRTGHSWIFPSMYSCPGPMLPHNELLMSPLLGSVAVFAFIAIWLRRRMTNEQD